MPEDKPFALATIAAIVLGLNGVDFLSDIACHMHNPDCGYQYDPIELSLASSAHALPASAVMVTMLST